MNQEKIGKFIASIRKEKKMTQKEVAEKLGVTDRAISKWENGRGLPDLSLIKPLCEVLDISINELLSGEKLNQENYNEKLEENMLVTIDYTDKKINKTRKSLVVVICVIILLFLSTLTLYTIDMIRMKQNAPVLFSTWGYEYAPALNIPVEEINNTIKNYLVEKGDSKEKYHDGLKTFVSMRVYLLQEEKKDEKYNVYAWVLEESYYKEDGKVLQDSGSSIPHKFTVEKIDDRYEVVGYEIPRDGNYYLQDMKKIFPYSVREDMDFVQYDGTITRLSDDIQEQVKR